jgi:hypothetical protein
MKIWEPKPPGTLWATPGLLRECFNFTLHKEDDDDDNDDDDDDDDNNNNNVFCWEN